MIYKQNLFYFVLQQATMVMFSQYLMKLKLQIERLSMFVVVEKYLCYKILVKNQLIKKVRILLWSKK